MKNKDNQSNFKSIIIKIAIAIVVLFFGSAIICGILGIGGSTEIVPTPTPTTSSTIEPTTVATLEPSVTTTPSVEPTQVIEDTLLPGVNKVIEDEFTVSKKVRNDVTGNWRMTKIADIKYADFQDYAVDYYNKYFENDNEVHAVINFATNTTTCIKNLDGALYVTIHEYVDKEEHDANKLFSGMILNDYMIYGDTGEITSLRD